MRSGPRCLYLRSFEIIVLKRTVSVLWPQKVGRASCNGANAPSRWMLTHSKPRGKGTHVSRAGVSNSADITRQRGRGAKKKEAETSLTESIMICRLGREISRRFGLPGLFTFTYP
jgi:hypothetical protein